MYPMNSMYHDPRFFELPKKEPDPEKVINRATERADRFLATHNERLRTQWNPLRWLGTHSRRGWERDKFDRAFKASELQVHNPAEVATYVPVEGTIGSLAVAHSVLRHFGNPENGTDAEPARAAINRRAFTFTSAQADLDNFDLAPFRYTALRIKEFFQRNLFLFALQDVSDAGLFEDGPPDDLGQDPVADAEVFLASVDQWPPAA